MSHYNLIMRVDPGGCRHHMELRTTDIKEITEQILNFFMSIIGYYFFCWYSCFIELEIVDGDEKLTIDIRPYITIFLKDLCYVHYKEDKIIRRDLEGKLFEEVVFFHNYLEKVIGRLTFHTHEPDIVKEISLDEDVIHFFYNDNQREIVKQKIKGIKNGNASFHIKTLRKYGLIVEKDLEFPSVKFVDEIGESSNNNKYFELHEKWKDFGKMEEIYKSQDFYVQINWDFLSNITLLKGKLLDEDDEEYGIHNYE